MPTVRLLWPSFRLRLIMGISGKCEAQTTCSVTIITNQTSPYQVEFMDAITQETSIDLHVVYLHSQRPGRNWQQPVFNHQHVVVDDDASCLKQANQSVESGDLTVFGYYRDPAATKLILRRSAMRRAWCFWGERMGVTRGAWAGQLYRRWKLRALHRDPAGIWGIGEFALERYRKEFENKRVYCNVPYFSNLSRFQTERHISRGTERGILFSGSFIQRKGVDLLTSAFCEVSREFPNLHLTLLGDGPERSHLESALTECRSRVTFTGFQDWNELPKFYHDADVLCVPSRHDGWGLVVPEGLAAGLPVIGTRRTGAALELIKEGVNGWLIDAGDVTQLTEALRKVARLSNEDLNTMSLAAVQSVANHQLSDGVRRFEQAVDLTLKSWHGSE